MPGSRTPSGSEHAIINGVDWLTDVAPVIASLSAVVGLLIAFEQLTAASRLRRESAFWRESQQAATRKRDQDVLESLQRTATARLIALKMIPGRWILFFILLIVNGLAVVWSTGYIVGDILPNSITWENLQTIPEVDPVLPAVIPIPVFGGFVGIASVFVRRRRVVLLYLDGENVTPLPVEITDTSIKVGFHLTFRQWIALVSLSFGLCGLSGFIGFVMGAGTEFLDSVQPWIAIWFLTSMLLFIFGGSAIRPLYDQGRELSVHPRAMRPRARVLANDTSLASSSPFASNLWKWLVFWR